MNKDGFTILELVAVLVILGILMALATPKLFESTERADVMNIQNNVMILESKTKETMLLDNRQSESWANIKDLSVLRNPIVEDLLYDTNGIVEDDTIINENNEPYKEIPKSIVKEELGKVTNGDYYSDKNGKVFFVYKGEGLTIFDTEH